MKTNQFCAYNCTLNDDFREHLLLTEMGRTWRRSDAIYGRSIKTSKSPLIRMHESVKERGMQSLVAISAFAFSHGKRGGRLPSTGRKLSTFPEKVCAPSQISSLGWPCLSKSQTTLSSKKVYFICTVSTVLKDEYANFRTSSNHHLLQNKCYIIYSWPKVMFGDLRSHQWHDLSIGYR